MILNIPFPKYKEVMFPKKLCFLGKKHFFAGFFGEKYKKCF